MQVHFSTIHHPWPWWRQTPGGDGLWHDIQFVLDAAAGAAGWLAVYDEPKAKLKTSAPRERRIIFITEPPGIKTYPVAYLNQFGILVSPYAVAGFEGRTLLQQSALPWHYGLDMRSTEHYGTALPWAELAADKPKSKLASVLCSNKAFLPHHMARLVFVERLKERLGDRVDVFGRGFNQIDDKAQAIAPYRYHIALENNLMDHGWTEKFGDAWLGDAYAIFAGCANADAYFDKRGFSQVDIRDPDRALDEIEQILNSTLWEDNRDAIRENRRRLMNEYNVFAEIAKIITRAEGATLAAAPVAPYKIKRSNQVTFPILARRTFNRARHALYQVQQWFLKGRDR